MYLYRCYHHMQLFPFNIKEMHIVLLPYWTTKHCQTDSGWAGLNGSRHTIFPVHQLSSIKLLNFVPSCHGWHTDEQKLEATIRKSGTSSISWYLQHIVIYIGNSNRNIQTSSWLSLVLRRMDHQLLTSTLQWDI